MNIFDVLRAPQMSEKTLSLKEEANQFAFKVDLRANKIQIKESIEKEGQMYIQENLMTIRSIN